MTYTGTNRREADRRAAQAASERSQREAKQANSAYDAVVAQRDALLVALKAYADPMSWDKIASDSMWKRRWIQTGHDGAEIAVRAIAQCEVPQ